ncbi:facilitated trehalose transporter Tret1-like [Phymastichus coffea]|uniref:facilitated trehalose transporter Tret1-like n=1 Tax=Phymastichus coffea TaxID=108790 RepID=UPI00273CD2F7|nr:facilitated trehalose transporter Tret1-like [Phymastichus coffea]
MSLHNLIKKPIKLLFVVINNCSIDDFHCGIWKVREKSQSPVSLAYKHTINVTMKQTDKSPFKASAASLMKCTNHVQWIAALAGITLCFLCVCVVSCHQNIALQTLFNDIAVLMLKVQLGIYVGWASPNFACLTLETSSIPATESDISWMISITSIAAAFGSIFGCVVMEYIGSRKTIIFTYLLMAISWTCLLVANTIVWLFISRMIGGIAYGILTCCFSIYLGEVAAPEIRGALVVLSIVGSPTGTIIGVIAETYLQIKVSSSIYLLTVLIGVVMFLWLKDTPYYLMKKNDVTAAKKSIQFYRGKVDVEKELNDIEKFVETSEGISDKLKKLKAPAVRKSLIIVGIAGALPNACGSFTIKSYMQKILERAQVSIIQPKVIVIYSYLISVASVLLAMSLIDRLGRRLLVILSSVGTAVSLTTLGLHFYLLKLNFDADVLQWLALSSLVCYLIAYAIGFEIIPGTLFSEMFSQNIKSIAVCGVVLMQSIIGFVVTKSYQPMVDYAGEAYAFWTHAFLSALGIPYAIVWLLETKGKKFHEIQDDLHRKSRSRKSPKVNDTPCKC